MRRSASEKMEIIRLVEGADLSVRMVLRQLGVPPSTFYGWYGRYEDTRHLDILRVCPLRSRPIACSAGSRWSALMSHG